jgi:predicted GNAT family N-acyltransferase
MTLILPLAGHHNRVGFDCGDDALNRWLSNVASQHKSKMISSTFVAVESQDSSDIYGFYSINITELKNEFLPQSMRKKLPLTIPAFRIGRLAVDSKYHGQGLGGLLLANALSRIVSVSDEIGGVLVLVDAKPTAVNFYLRYGFERFEDHPESLFIPIQTLKSRG